jgi:hypothetical protein
MSKIALEGNVSGSGTLTIAAPNTNSNFTLSLPTNTGTIITQNSTPAFASTIGVGGATAAASGAGITFPATQSASSDANTLDDYEEGSFTPQVDNGSGGNMTIVGVQIGKYIKIGNLVFISITVTGITKSGSGSLKVKGLPFTVGSSANATDQSALVRWQNINTDSQMLGYFNASSTEILMQDIATNGFSGSVTISDASASFDFYNIIGCYLSN